jgi:hypothetical protein
MGGYGGANDMKGAGSKGGRTDCRAAVLVVRIDDVDDTSVSASDHEHRADGDDEAVPTEEEAVLERLVNLAEMEVVVHPHEA